MHRRALTLTTRKHLIVKGMLTAETSPSCTRGQQIVVQRRASSRWRRVATVTTRADGSFRASVQDRTGTYRAIGPVSTLDSGRTSCGRAVSSTTRHRHE
jgi:hypothetical protein